MFAATAARDADLRATVHQLPGFTAALATALTSARRFSGPLRPVLSDLRPGARLLRPVLDRATAVAPDLERLATDLDGFTRVAPSGLRAARSFLDATRPLLAKLYPFGRQLAPILAYAKLYRRELANSWPKVDAVLEARSKDANGTMTHYLRATAVTSNDTAAGSVHRQPYTRPSTYAAPGGIRSIESIGVLKAFDCSHLGNPVETPAVGPFTKCVEQAPVTFQGLTSQFPHVRAAP